MEAEVHYYLYVGLSVIEICMECPTLAFRAATFSSVSVPQGGWWWWWVVGGWWPSS